MSDEFTEHDLGAPTEQDLDQAYGSKYLSAAEVGDKKIRTRILKVRKEDMRTDDGNTRMKFVLFLEALDKPMVLNATNKDALVDTLGRIPANWVGASVGIFVDPNVKFAGKRVKGLRLRVLSPRRAPSAAAKVVPKSPAAPSTVEQGDLDLDDAVPDFSEPIPY